MKKLPYIIVGQGLAGTMLALEMEKAGIPFQIIASPSKTSASSVAAGIVNPLVFKRLTKSWMVDEALPFAIDTYSALETRFSKKFFHPIDILKPLSKQEFLLWNEKKESGGFDDYISNIEKDKYQQGLHRFYGFGQVKNSGCLETSLFLKTLAKYFTNNGNLLRANFEYDDVRMEKENVFWKGSEVAGIIFCKGFHSIYNPYFKFIKFAPSKGELLLVNAPELSGNYIYTKKVYVLPVGRSVFKVGSTYNWDDFTDQPTKAGRESIEDRLQDLISVPYKVEQHWAGVRPTVKDRRPVMGFHPEYPGLGMFNGLGTKGVMLAPYFAKEMVKLIQDKNHSINPEVALGRFYDK